MVDHFVDRVATLAGDTTRALAEIASILRSVGLTNDARLLDTVARQHAQIALDCLVETQPIELARDNFSGRLRTYGVKLQELSADMLAHGKKGYHEVARTAGELLAIADLHE